MASRWIRAGKCTRNAMIPLVERYDKILDQGIVDAFIGFISIQAKDFLKIMDKWYNPELFYQDKWGIWHEIFKV